MQSPGDFSNMDIGNVGDSGENTNMDSDDLVPSLQVSTGHVLEFVCLKCKGKYKCVFGQQSFLIQFLLNKLTRYLKFFFIFFLDANKCFNF